MPILYEMLFFAFMVYMRPMLWNIQVGKPQRHHWKGRKATITGLYVSVQIYIGYTSQYIQAMTKVMISMYWLYFCPKKKEQKDSPISLIDQFDF